MPRSEDPAAIVAFPRGHLRRDFLAADMGFVGVNAAVAATGDLLTVTNEGNGRLCSALPRVPVALAGIGKAVASPDP